MPKEHNSGKFIYTSNEQVKDLLIKHGYRLFQDDGNIAIFFNKADSCFDAIDRAETYTCDFCSF